VLGGEKKKAHPENKYFYRPMAIPIVWTAAIVTLDLEQIVSIYLA